MAGLLEYTTLTLPKLVPEYTRSFENRDPLLGELRRRNKRNLGGGTNVRLRRIKGRVSDVVELSGTNFTIPRTAVSEAFSVMTADWGRLGFSITFPHLDRDRLPTPQERKAWVNERTKAAMMAYMMALRIRIYTGALYGSNPAFAAIGTLNGSTGVTGTKTGLENGALKFQTPADQATGATTYLSETRVWDETYYTNNWANQYIAHNGIGVDFLATVEEIKATADDYLGEDESGGGISIGVLSIANKRKLNEEIRLYGTAGMSAIHYTVDDVKKGNILPDVTMASGVRYYANRWMQTAARADNMNGPTEPCLLINPDYVEWWVNAGLDAKVGKVVDLSDITGELIDACNVQSEIQLALPSLIVHGCTSRA